MVRARDLDGFTAPADFARIRFHHAVDDFDQSAFSRAIFSEQRMHFARRDLQVHAIVGECSRKLLGDAFEAEQAGQEGTLQCCQR